MSVEETGSLELFEGKQQEITRQELVERVSEHVNRILRRNLYELKLDEKQTFRLLRQKEELRRYLKEAGTGNLQVKEYLISFIQEFLLNGMKMDEEMIKHTFFFSEKGSRQAAVRFDILLFLYKEQYGSGAMEKLIEEHGLLSGTENVITEEQIEHVYGVCGRKLKFIEQIELLSRKIYAYYKGLGAIDELRDMKIDGVSGGVSGKEGTYHSAWIFYHGRSVWLPFLDFEREEEMERISRNLCRYHQPGEISRKKGYLVHEMADHARVVVARPDFVDNVVPAEEACGIEINEAFLGSCNNGRIEDLRVGAEIIKGKKVSDKVRFLVVPASQTIYRQALKEGIIDTFMEAGAIVMNPNCSVCWGSCQGVIGENEVLISTGTRNFKGRAGHPSSKVYLGSAATVTASAIAGKIATADQI